jgi:RNA polymerase sigma-70 factor (ECF subfamily)
MDSPIRIQAENSAYSRKTEQELLLLCEADPEAFGELARRYRAMAFRAAISVLRNDRDAEDQVQSAFCKAFEHIHEFRKSAKFSTWLTRIVVNECLMQLRQRRRVSILSIESSPERPALSLAVADSASPEKLVIHISIRRLLEREIRRIPPLLRHAFILRDVQQKPMVEVARRLGISVEAAKSRLSRAREELRGRLEPHLSTRQYSEVILPKNTRKEKIA